MNSIIEHLNWRYATKKFDSSKKVSTDDLRTIQESLRLTATSYGLQAQKFLIIESAEVREQLKPVSYNQSQITDASHIIVLCSQVDLTDQDVDNYAELIAKERNVDVSSLAGFAGYIKQATSAFSTEQKSIWLSKQSYIALGQVLHTLAELRIDSTPMEGFQASEYDRILGLSEKGLKADLVCAIGYRHEEDAAQHNVKVRKSIDDLFEII